MKEGLALAWGKDHGPTGGTVVYVPWAPLDSLALTVIEVLDLPRGDKMLL